MVGWKKSLFRIENGDATSKDLDLLVSIASNIEGRTVCALGDAAAWPIRGFITKFRQEFEKRIHTERKFIAPNIVHGKRETASTLIYEL